MEEEIKKNMARVQAAESDRQITLFKVLAIGSKVNNQGNQLY